MKSGVIAIVGRPNVGKSTIFNRIAGARVSIVEDIPGVTRDRIYATGEWTGNHFELIDTGGIQLEGQPYQEEILAQVQIAIQEADVIIMVCDGKGGMSDDDRYIAGMLQRSKKPVVLAVNQIDDASRIPNIYEFYALGIGDPIAVSGVHGIGVGDVLDACMEKLPEEDADKKEEGIRIAVIGQPNVGKSSLLNALLEEDKAIVTDIAGTTRDLVEGQVRVGSVTLNLIDTAGIRESDNAIEQIGIRKSLEALEKAQLVIVVLDGSEQMTEDDAKLLEMTKDRNRIVVYNKKDKKAVPEGISISAINGDVESLVQSIEEKYAHELTVVREDTLNNERQIGLAMSAEQSMKDAITSLEEGMELDLVTIDLEKAWNALKEITGKAGREDLLDEIFSRFCLGK